MRFVGVEKGLCALAADMQSPSGRSPIADRILARRPGDSVSLTGPEHCPRCDRDLPRDAFANDRSRPSGRHAICADCVSVAGKRYWQTLCASKRREKVARSRARPRATDIERARTARAARDQVVAQAMARGLSQRLAAGLSVDGRRSWKRPDRRAERVG